MLKKFMNTVKDFSNSGPISHDWRFSLQPVADCCPAED